ncbi:MAG: hypothetical protein ACLVJ6_07705 [Merdibacter sp.]
MRDTVIISSGFTVAVAIFQFRFLYQRNAAIFMMGVPLKRRQLFHYCWFSGWLALLPIAAINGGCAAADDMSGISAILASILYQTLNYAITVFFVSAAAAAGCGADRLWLAAGCSCSRAPVVLHDRSQFFISRRLQYRNMQHRRSPSPSAEPGRDAFGQYWPARDGVMAVVILLAIAAFYWSRRSFEQLK